jgi:hypothetical protein
MHGHVACTSAERYRMIEDFIAMFKHDLQHATSSKNPSGIRGARISVNSSRADCDAGEDRFVHFAMQ